MGQPAPHEAYERGFRARLAAMRQPGQEAIDGPGIVGLVGRDPGLRDGRFLVTDDRALDLLTDLLPQLLARVVNVSAGATACHALLAADAAYRPEPCTTMICRDLQAMPAVDLTEGLFLRPVSRGTEEADGVSLRDAADAALRSEPSAAPDSDLDGFVAYLRSVPNARYLAAVDDAHRVRATAAVALFGDDTGVFFVNTDPAWRGRGVATAMTAAALRAAAEAGARRAHLDASTLGVSLYRRLGFTVVGPATLFVDQR